VKLELLEELNSARADKRPVVLMTELEGGAQRLVDADTELSPSHREAVGRALTTDRSQLQGAWFFRPFNPPLRMLVVGGVHIAQSLVPMAQMAGYAVTVIDPRGAFASPERFEGVALDNAWPDEAMEKMRVDARTAVVTLTHDPKIDDPALCFALRSDAFYIGALGSTRTQGARLERLREQGFDDEKLARIHGPIGLPLGGRSPAEIAIAIMAEVTHVLRKGRT
jgi:xanthine dehydrogenase accessory factor